MIRFLAAAAVIAALGAPFVLSASPASAQDKMAPKMAPAQKMTPASKMAKKSPPVYVCKECKVYTSAAKAKKMGYKDGMGHKLVKMDKAPAGYVTMTEMKKMEKMGKMGDHKMGGGKMSKGDGKM